LRVVRQGSGNGATATSSVFASDVCFRATATLTSTADMRRVEAIPCLRGTSAWDSSCRLPPLPKGSYHRQTGGSSDAPSSDRPGWSRTDICHLVLTAPRRMKRTTSCGASWMRSVARSAEAEHTQVLVEVAHPRRQGKRLNARCFSAFGQCGRGHATRGIGVAGCRAAAASAGAEGQQGGWPRARQPSAWQAPRSAATASSRCLRRQRGRRRPRQSGRHGRGDWPVAACRPAPCRSRPAQARCNARR
jgi:hypothetical protein